MLVVASMFTLGACSQESRDVIEQVSQIKYTGDATTDLRTLCTLSSSVNALNNAETEKVKTAVVKAAEQFAIVNDDQRITDGIKYLKWSVDADAGVREQGEENLRKLCDTI